jgi:putative copper export protein
MLISQAYLIRTKHNALHRRVGKFSYALVPLILFTTLDLLHYQLRNAKQMQTMNYFFVALVVNALIAFMIFYGLAIFYRKRSGLHARYMVSTVFPFVTPATDRIIGVHFPS